MKSARDYNIQRLSRSTLVLLAILVLAAALRFYRIDTQSLWSDEGSSVVQATRDVASIVANAAADIHPPLYYVLLHFWVMPFGTSEVGVRSFSALLGVTLVLMCFLLGRQLWDERTGMVAAALAALNPFQIYYSQEARMYMLLAVLGALCLYALLGILRRPLIIAYDELASWRGDWWRYGWHALYTLAMALGLYTH
ncbi:MAG: glycosyltransferase family 39 protein, partial [Chloroflexi bacterium]|nr:glycosyltransferase family 39 protein [Chloroflexota bacterium]